MQIPKQRFALVKGLTLTEQGYIHTDDSTTVIEYTTDVLSAMITVMKDGAALIPIAPSEET